MTIERRPLAILRDDEEDPITSVVNLIDVFLVIIAVLLMVIIQNPLNPLASDSVVVVKNPGQENMEMIVKEGETLKHYTSSGEVGEGEGVKAGITYKLQDGSMVYIPEG